MDITFEEFVRFKNQRHQYCFECGRKLPSERHGLVKFCSIMCQAVYRRKYRILWWKKKKRYLEMQKEKAIKGANRNKELALERKRNADNNNPKRYAPVLE